VSRDTIRMFIFLVFRAVRVHSVRVSCCVLCVCAPVLNCSLKSNFLRFTSTSGGPGVVLKVPQSHCNLYKRSSFDPTGASYYFYKYVCRYWYMYACTHAFAYAHVYLRTHI